MKILEVITIPQESVNDQSLVILELPLKNGDRVNAGQVIAVLESSKASIELECRESGFIYYFCKEGDELKLNELVAHVTSEIQAVNIIPQKNTNEKRTTVAETKIPDKSIFSSEALTFLAASKLDTAVFFGRDFVTKRDVEEYLSNSGALLTNETKSPKLTTDETNKIDLKNLSVFKKREIQYLSSVQSFGLRSTIHVQVQASLVREYLNTKLKYFKGSLLPVILYETSLLLKRYPELNAYLNGDSIAFYKAVRIGFAIDIDKGLKVVALSPVEGRSILDIEGELIQRSNEYLDDKLGADLLTDITFTVTDLSSEGVHFFTPLVNMKNSAILGISSVDKLGQCILSMSFDHRVTEGKRVANFLNDLKNRIESYSSEMLIKEAKKSVSCYRCLRKLQEDLANVGFVRCITPDGEEAYICQSCFKGF